MSNNTSNTVKTSEYFEHLTRPGERWDTIAWDYYKDPDKMDLIINENRELFLPNLDAIPSLLQPSITLRIPVIEQSSVNDQFLPPWKKGLEA